MYDDCVDCCGHGDAHLGEERCRDRILGSEPKQPLKVTSLRGGGDGRVGQALVV